jgi:hypothetical protein
MTLIRGNKETEDDPEGVAKLHSGDWSICLKDHFKPYTPQSWALWKSGQKKPFLKENTFGVRQKACGRLPKHMEEGTLVRRH